MRRERDVLLAHREAQRRHVLAAVEGLGEEDLTRTVAPSGWSIAQPKLTDAGHAASVR